MSEDSNTQDADAQRAVTQKQNAITVLEGRLKQAEWAAQAALESAERAIVKVGEMRAEHLAWYEAVRDSNSARIDAEVQLAANRMLPGILDSLVSKEAVRQAGQLITDRCVNTVLDRVCRADEVRDIKKMSKAVKAIMSLIKASK